MANERLRTTCNAAIEGATRAVVQRDKQASISKDEQNKQSTKVPVLDNTH